MSRRNCPNALKAFPIFLTATLATEVIASVQMKNTGNNIVLYNLFSIVEFVFYLYIIREIVINRKVKRLILVTMFIYPVISLIYIFFIRGIYYFHVATYSVGCLIIVAYAIYYFYELFANPTSVDLKKEPAFWIITGLLFFYTCSFPIYGLANLISGVTVIARNIGAVLVIINVILYSLFTVAFLCKIKTRKLSS